MEGHMRNRRLALAGALTIVWLAPIFPRGQTPSTKAAALVKTSSTVPRTPWGDPDLQGIWNNSTTTPLERPASAKGKEFLTARETAERDEHAERSADDAPAAGDPGTYNGFWFDRGKSLTRTSLIVDPPDGRLPPYTADAQKRLASRAESRRRQGPEPADGPEDRNLAERCITRGAPKLPGGYNNNFQIVQTPQYVAILQEMIHEVRIIPLDKRPHINSRVRLWLGDSRALWDGNTLVVDTTNYDERIVDNSFNCCRGAGANLHVIERFTRVDANTIDFRYTVDDPTTWTKSWTAVVPMTRSDEPIYEYACHEGNYGLAGILRGARVLEKVASGNHSPEKQ
jgi:hypothetical protein